MVLPFLCYYEFVTTSPDEPYASHLGGNEANPLECPTSYNDKGTQGNGKNCRFYRGKAGTGKPNLNLATGMFSNFNFPETT